MDFDIDAVSLASFDISKSGKLEIWSPYANYHSYDTLMKSLELPMPNNVKYSIDRVSELSNELLNESNQTDPKKLTDLIQQGLNDKVLILDDKGKVHINNRVTRDERGQYIDNLYKLGEFLRKWQTNIDEVSTVTDKTVADFCGYLKEVLKVKGIKNDKAESIIKDVIDLVNKHTTYMTNSSTFKQQSILKNYVFFNMYQVGRDPINLIQGQTPVDSTKEIFNEEGAKAAKKNRISPESRTTGSFAEKAEGIVENQTGKGGIGISAVGLKDIAGIQHYMNVVSRYGTPEQKERMVFGSTEKRGVTFTVVDENGNTVKKTYYLMPDVSYSKKTRSELDINLYADLSFMDKLSGIDNLEEVIKTLQDEIENEGDSSVLASALLSLSTDNAKDLTLSKLNATMNTLGMYLYGITIGMDVKTLIKHMTSDVGLIISEIINGNKFANDPGTFSMLSTFDYFELGPRNYLDKFKFRVNKNDKTLIEETEGTTAYSFFIYLLQLLNDSKLRDYCKTISGTTQVTDFDLKEFGKSGPLDEKLKEINRLRSFGMLQIASTNGLTDISKDLSAKFNLLLDFIEKYIIQYDVINKDKVSYDLIKQLAEGAEEMRVIGRIYSLNQGYPTKTQEILDLVAAIRGIIKNRVKIINRDRVRQGLLKIDESKISSINLQLLVSNKEYLNTIAEEYNKYKHTFNVIDAITQVPHFKEYLTNFVIGDEGIRLSVNKYQMIADVGSALIQKLKVSSKKGREKVYAGVQRFYDAFVRDDYFLQRNVTYRIPEGTKYYDDHFVELTAPKGGQVIQLGTKWGNASFKRFVETRLVPDLKSGIIGTSEKISDLAKNEFIRSLTPLLYTKNVSNNNSLNESASFNMMPNTDTEISIFNKMKQEFLNLGVYNYHVEGDEYAVLEMLFHYNLIAYQNRIGLQSFTKMFEDITDSDFYSDFLAFEQDFDDNKALITEFVEPGLKSVNKNGDPINQVIMVELEEILPYVVGIENSYITNSKYFFAKDGFRNRLAELNESEGYDENYDEDTRSETLDAMGVDDEQIYGSVRKSRFSFLGNDIKQMFPGNKVNVRSYDNDFTEGYNINKGKITNIEVDIEDEPITLGDGVEYTIKLRFVTANIVNHLIESVDLITDKGTITVKLSKPINYLKSNSAFYVNSYGKKHLDNTVLASEIERALFPDKNNC